MPDRSNSGDDFDFEIVDDDESCEDSKLFTHWKILVVDDEEEMHHSTRFALENVSLLGCPIKLIHAYSAKQAREVLIEQNDVAVLLLDVVMEEPDAGLKLVDEIRKMGFEDIRIILRTGQPGYAPMFEVVRDYDINDYHTKTEMTRNRLICSILTALRSWQQIRIINESRQGLEMVVESSHDLFKRKNMELFSQGVLKQLISIQAAQADGMVCKYLRRGDLKKGAELLVVTASGTYEKLTNTTINSLDYPEILEVFEHTLTTPEHLHLSSHLGVYVELESEKNLFIYIDNCEILHSQQIALLKLFATNVSVGFENLTLIEQLDQLAYIDLPLDIPNANALDQKLEEVRRAGVKDLFLISLKIKSAAQCIGAFGQDTFNQLLKAIYSNLQEIVLPKPYIIATNGRSDLLLLTDSVEQCLAKIHEIFRGAIVIDDIEVKLSAQTAVVKIDENMDAYLAIKNSITAMQSTKNRNIYGNFEYESSMTSDLQYRVNLQSKLNKAIQNASDINAWLQPKVSMFNRRIVGAEALCRWKLDGEYVPPSTFIPISEATGMVERLTYLMLDRIKRFDYDMGSENESKFCVAINLSMREIQTKGFAKTIDSYIRSRGYSTNQIEFEITESFLMSDVESAIQELTELKNLGYSISLDDFGTGYSSLSYLDRLPIDFLKIDRSFVSKLLVSPSHYNLTKYTISLAKKMGITVIAEGIESVEQHNTLASMGCDIGQGYYYGHPVPVENFTKAYGEGPLPA